MLSSIIRLGVAMSGAALLSSCGGDSVAETQQSTPEGVYTGLNNLNETMLVFVVSSGAYYAFYSGANSPSGLNPTTIAGAAAGTIAFSGGTMVSTDTEDLSLHAVPQSNDVTTVNGVNVGALTGVNFPSFAGAYNTGQNIAATLTYPVSGVAVTFNLNYSSAYQGIQNLSTLAGTYNGTVGSSGGSEKATFTFSTASVLANSGNELGVATISGTGASGCSYTGSVSPLFKGNGYSVTFLSGGPPCLLPNTQFSGLLYLDPTTNNLYLYAPNAARTDGLIFTATQA